MPKYNPYIFHLIVANQIAIPWPFPLIHIIDTYIHTYILSVFYAIQYTVNEHNNRIFPHFGGYDPLCKRLFIYDKVEQEYIQNISGAVRTFQGSSDI